MGLTAVCCIQLDRCLQDTQQQAPAAKDAAASPDAGRKSSEQALRDSNGRAALGAKQQAQSSAPAGGGAAIHLSSSSEDDDADVDIDGDADDMPRNQQAPAARRSILAAMEVTALPSCVTLMFRDYRYGSGRRQKPDARLLLWLCPMKHRGDADMLSSLWRVVR